jgi:hypothetical protein
MPVSKEQKFPPKKICLAFYLYRGISFVDCFNPEIIVGFFLFRFIWGCS